MTIDDRELERLLAAPQHMADFNAPPLSDLGNAERFVFLFGDRVRHCPPTKTWYVWDGRRWARDDMGRARLLAQRVSAAINDEASMIRDADVRESFRKWARSTAMAGKITAMLDCASCREEIAVPPDAFDRDPLSLNCENGTVDLATGALRAHRREDMISALAPVSYDPDAAAPEFSAFVYHATGAARDGGALLDWLQRFLGYCSSGDTSEQRFGLFCGLSETGKTSLLNIVRDTLGPEYAGVVKAESLFAPYERESELDFVRVARSRLVTASEGKEGRRLPEAFIKAATGSETLSMREMYAGSREFKPKFKLVLGTNHKPSISEGGNSIWRRMVFVPFNHPIVDKDVKFADRVSERERPGVLAWLVRGYRALLDGAFSKPPEVVRGAMSEYMEEEDVVREFIRTNCEWIGDPELPADSTVTPETETPFNDLYKVFRVESEKAGDRFVISSKTFASRLNDLNIKKGLPTGKQRMKTRRGIQLSQAGQEKLLEHESARRGQKHF